MGWKNIDLEGIFWSEGMARLVRDCNSAKCRDWGGYFNIVSMVLTSLSGGL